MTNVLDVRNLCVRYSGQARDAVHDVSFGVRKGEIVALVGPNGGGKSSVLKAVAQVTPARGEVVVMGQAIGQLRRRERVSLLSYVPQEPELDVDLAVRDILRLGVQAGRGPFGRARAEDSSRIEHALGHVGMLERAGARWSELSGGQRQRVSVARGLVQEAALLLLDEPTNHLDIRHQLELVPLLRHVVERHDAGVLVVLHDLGLAARIADRVVVIDAGEVVAAGIPEEALSSELIEHTFNVAGHIHRERNSEATALVMDLLD